ncbi:MAG: phospho-sugar mutase [Bdellovibrionales bacterium]|nr:phospho-sugar mutase [Bdellovibrionales bacterium]
MEQRIIERAQSWATNPYFSKEAQAEIKQLLDSSDENELTERFYKDLEFGTGGMRSVIGMGDNRINIYTIRRATTALAMELLSGKSERPKVAIGYDSRRFSFEFAREVAMTLAANQVEAYLFDRLNPVALLSFAVRHLKADAGVMVTASHNPPEYNGYKVYWSDGCQVTAPNDQNIINHYNSLNDFSKLTTIEFEQGKKDGLIKIIGNEVVDAYFEAVNPYIINRQLGQEQGKNINICYSPIHGTGLIPCLRVLESMGLTNYQVVKEQEAPDGNFPTVTSPNPENPQAMKMVGELMESCGGDIALATDPDCDRIGVALRHQGQTHYLNGNQIGTLMFHYVALNLTEQSRLPENSYLVKTIVTTELMADVAKHFHIGVENTLTGFKWICGKVREHEQNSPEKNFLFGTEESFGYLNHGHVRDKDAVAPLGLIAEMALWYKEQDKTLLDGLDDIHRQFGFAYEDLLCLNYHGKDGAEKIKRIMEYFRKNSGEEICGQQVVKVEDYQTQKVSYLLEQREDPLLLPVSNVLGFTFDSGMKLYLRPSGTEPKIKFYLMVREQAGGDLARAKEAAQQRAEQVVDYLTTRSNQV